MKTKAFRIPGCGEFQDAASVCFVKLLARQTAEVSKADVISTRRTDWIGE